MKLSLKSLSIRTQILILTLSLVVIALGLLIVVAITQIDSESHGLMEQEAIDICTIVAESIGPGLESGDSASVIDYVQGVLTDDDIAGIYIYNENGVRAFKTAGFDFPENIILLSDIADTLTINYFGEKCIATRSVYAGNKKVGKILVAISEQLLVARIKSSIGLILIVALLLSIIVVIVASIVSTFIVKPITLFEKASDKICGGDVTFEIEIPYLHKDFRSLGIAFNKMKNALASAFDELNQAKIDLEERVLQRTKDLQQELAERKLAEQALEESEQKLKSIIDNISIGIALISPSMEILSLNKKMRDWYPQIDINNSPICYKAFNSSPRDTICDYCPVHLTLKDGLTHESTTENPAGEEIRHYRIISTPIKNAKGEIISAIEMVEDITSQKREEIFRKDRSDFLRNLVGQNDAGEIAALAFKYLSTLMPYDSGMLVLYNSRDTRSPWQTVYSLDTDDNGNRIIDDKRQTIYPSRVSQLKEVVLEKKMRIIHRDEDQYNEASINRDNAFGNINKVSRSLAYFPLLIKNQVVGAITVQSYQANIFDQNLIAILDLVSADLALALNAIMHQEATRESEAKLSLAIDMAKLGYWEYDVADDLFTFDDHFYSIFRTSAEKVGGYRISPARYTELFIHPDDAAVVATEMKKAFETTDPNFNSQIEHRILYADGEVGYISVNYYVVKDDQGRTIKTYGVNQDITERKRVAEELRKKTEQLQLALHVAQMGVWQHNLNLNVITTIHGSGPISGLPEDVYPNSLERLMALVHPEDRETLGRQIQQAAEDEGDFEAEFRLLLPDDIIHWVFARGQFSRDAEKNLILTGVDLDITERKQAEEKLLELKNAVEQSADGIALAGLDGHIRFANKTWARMHGYSVDELIGQHLGIFHTKQQLETEVNPFTRRMLETGSAEGEIGHARRDGTTFPTRMVTTVLMGADQKPYGMLGIARDITEQKRAEEMLRKSEENYRLLFSEMSSGFALHEIICDDKGKPYDYRYFEINPAFEKLTGLKGANIIGKTIREVMPGIEPHWIEAYGQVALTGQSTHIEDYVKELDRYYDTIAYCPQPGRFAIVFNEITERKRAEQELRESEERFKSISESAKDVIIMVDPEGKISFWNAAAENTFNYTYKEAMGKNIHELIAPDRYRDKFRTEFEGCRASGSNQAIGKTIEFIAKRRDGREFPIELSVSPLLLRDQWHAVAIIRDITERQRVEEALRESEAKYRTLFDTANDAILIMQDDMFIDCNVHTLEMFGCKWEQIIGETPYMFSPVYQSDGTASKVKALEYIRAAMNGTPQSFEWLHCRLDRTPFFAEINLSRMEFNDETFILSIVRDITERKKAEEQKRSYQEKLERAERMESLGILAGGIAHDLNNILGPLVGYPELMLMKLPDDSPLRKQVKRIGRAAQGAADVVQDLLTLARRGRYEMAPIDINDIVEAYLDSPSFMKLTEKHPDVKSRVILQKPIGYILGSFHHLLKVFMNLVINAFDAMPGGGELTIESKQQFAEKLLSGFEKIEKGDYIILSVRDTGMGIDPKDFAKIFEPYYSKKKMGTSGSGLGLSVVYGIVKDHKAYYDILSDIGKGTEFFLYFPVGENKIEQNTTVVQEIEGAETILVVDDMEEQREIASELLTSMNYQVATACNGREAVKYLSNHQVDIVMLDMIMENDFDGLDTYREIIKIHPGQKAIIASGFSSTDRVQEIMRLSGGEYIKKPYTREALGRAIRNTLDRQMIVQNR